MERLKQECLEAWSLVESYSRYSEKNVAVDDEDLLVVWSFARFIFSSEWNSTQ